MQDHPWQVICIKWGRKFGPEYVNRLHAMIARNVTRPFTLHCFTEITDGLRPEVVAHPLPELGCPLPERTRGKWPKTALWGRELDGLSGPALFIDLDAVITGNMDGFFEYGEPADVILARNWLRPLQKLGQTSIFRFPVGGHPYILEDFQRDAQAIADTYKWEQHYVTKGVRGGVKFWPDAWVRHYRHHCLGFWPLRYFRSARLPQDARVVVFPGDPNPHDALVGQWDDIEGPVGAWRHIRNTWTGPRVKRGALSHLKAFQRPCPWVAEHWRE